MMLDDLIPPEVVTVGGFPSRLSSTTDDQTMTGYSASAVQHSEFGDFQRHSYRSSMSASSLHSYMRDGHSLSSSMTSASRRGSSPSLRDNETEKQAVARTEAFKAERAKAKQDIKDNKVAMKALDKSDKVLGRVPKESMDLSFADMLDADPVVAAPTKDQLRAEKASLKAHAKALKEAEKQRKEAAKMEKLKAAVQARNDKIDAHDRAVREKQAAKEAQKLAKLEAARTAWNDRAKSESEAIWQNRGNHDLLAKTHALRV